MFIFLILEYSDRLSSVLLVPDKGFEGFEIYAYYEY